MIKLPAYIRLFKDVIELLTTSPPECLHGAFSIRSQCRIVFFICPPVMLLPYISALL